MSSQLEKLREVAGIWPCGHQRRPAHEYRSATVSGTPWSLCSSNEATDMFKRCPSFEYRAIYSEADMAALLDKLERLQRVIAWANNSLFGSHNFFLSANGGPDDEHHLDRKIEELKELSRKALLRSTALTAERDALKRERDEARRIALGSRPLTTRSE